MEMKNKPFLKEYNLVKKNKESPDLQNLKGIFKSFKLDFYKNIKMSNKNQNPNNKMN